MMSFGNDFLELISVMWDIEQFDMWIPREHGSVAYLLDRLSLTDNYKKKYDELYALAKNKNANEFAMKATLEIVELSKMDARVSEEDIRDLELIFAQQEEDYRNQKMLGVGIVKQKYMPDWFFELFHGYITLEKLKRETAILKYCELTENKSKEEAKEIYEKLESCSDILNEFYFFIKNERFKSFYPIAEENLTAHILCESLDLSPLEGYLYLMFIRKEPENALAEYKAKLETLSNKNKNKVEEQIPMEETKQVEVENEGGEEVIPTPSDDNAVLEKLEALQQAMQGLQECFDSKIATDTHKNGLFDNMHKELTRYQNGAMDKIVDTIALDIIQLVDTTKGHLRVYEKKEPNEENYKRLLRIVKGITEDLQDILYRQSIEAYRVEGHEVDVRRQKIIQTIPTDDQSKDNLVAVRAADGYEKDGKVLRPERIKIFKYSTEATNNSDEN